MRLGNGVGEVHQPAAVSRVLRQEVDNLRQARVERPLDDAPYRSLGQALDRRVHGHQTPRVHQLLLASQDLVIRRLEDEAAAKDVHLPADHQARPRLEGGRQVGLIEPDGADVPGVVAQHGLGRATPVALARLGGLPHRHDHGLVFAQLQLGDLADLGEVVVSMREVEYEVLDLLQPEALQLGKRLPGDALEVGYGGVERDRRDPPRGSPPGGPGRLGRVLAVRTQPGPHGPRPLLPLERRQYGVGPGAAEHRLQLFGPVLQEAVEASDDGRVLVAAGPFLGQDLPEGVEPGVGGGHTPARSWTIRVRTSCPSHSICRTPVSEGVFFEKFLDHRLFQIYVIAAGQCREDHEHIGDFFT